MNRQEIESNYKINEHGIICSPGKFEGEMIYAPYFYDLIMEGGSSETDFPEGEDGPCVDIFYPTEEDVAEFPELEGCTRVECMESEQGFFYCYTE